MDCERATGRTGSFEGVSLSRERLDVRWEPSPRDVISEMIKIAGVGSKDVFYDLGCGDGRVVIDAVNRTGARGVGIDLDPARIKECHWNAMKEEASNIVRFMRADLFESDISEAMVLFIFLFPDVNLRLRPKLLEELRPGTRIVSYCHDMGRWEPDHRVMIRDNYLYLWVVPANMSGRWEGGIEAEGEKRSLLLELHQEFQRVSGSVYIGGEVVSVRNIPIGGDRFRFSIDGPEGDITLSGSVGGDEINGIMQGDRRFPEGFRRWTAQRPPGTCTPLAR